MMSKAGVKNSATTVSIIFSSGRRLPLFHGRPAVAADPPEIAGLPYCVLALQPPGIEDLLHDFVVLRYLAIGYLPPGAVV